MTKRDQLGLANEIAVLCGLAAQAFDSHCSPSEAQRKAVQDLEGMSALFLELTDEDVEGERSPKALGICPACGEELA